MSGSHVQRLQLYVEPWLYEALRRESFKRKRSLSSIVRDTMAEHFTGKARPRGSSKLLEASGTLHDKTTDVSSRHDDYLWGEP